MKSFISLDVETNGLDGQIYAVAMQLYRKGILYSSYCWSCPITEELDEWIQKNPHLAEVQNSIVTTYEDMLQEAADTFKAHACTNDNEELVEAWGNPDFNATPVLYHCGMAIEGRFFQTLRDKGLLGKFERPMAPIEVADYLRMKGENPYSVDAYMAKYALVKPEGETHNPLFDCEVAAQVYLHLIQ